MRKTAKVFLLILLIFTSISLGIFLLMSLYYRNVFFANTWINDIYCTGKSIDEVNKELLHKDIIRQIKIISKDNEEYTLDLKEIGYSLDYSQSLENYIDNQTTILWFNSLFCKTEAEIEPVINIDSAGLNEVWDSIPFVAYEQSRPENLNIVMGDNGYELVDGLVDHIDKNKAVSYICSEIKKGESVIELVNADVYYNLEPDSAQKAVYDKWEKINYFINCNLVYDMGTEKIPFTPKLMSEFIAVDEDGNIKTDESDSICLDEVRIEEFVSELCREYDTCGLDHNFHTTDGRDIVVSGGIYGTLLDGKEEISFLKENLLKDELHGRGYSELSNHIPAYKQEALVRGKNDIGDTYIEVDMTNQKLYCYVDGSLELESDIVTGNMNRRMDTPSGVNYIYAKQKNRVLRGPNYASFVNYWMPVKGSIGLHDATWRDEFGGDIYLTSGSHGCVNIPLENMDIIYDTYEIGTPVVMYY